MDTIFALATARGKSGVAVIRVSGPAAHTAVRALCGDVPTERRASLRTLRETDGTVLDVALVLTFADSRSFTGEASAEFHVHGSNATIAAVLRALGTIDGLRLAEPGEFTRRALENGRMDLAEVEGLADLIEAETEAQRKQALRVLSGAVAGRVAEWRAALVHAMGLLAVSIDFADEEVPESVGGEVAAKLREVRDGLMTELAGAKAAERVRDGFEVAIVGPPNVGKSTLLNALAGREAAITSEIAGTTRDVIEVRMDIAGLPVTLLDTAGIRETDDRIEALGVARARARAEAADLRVYLSEGSMEADPPMQPGDLQRCAKCDAASGDGPGISGLTGAGVSDLLTEIGRILGARAASAGIVTQERHRKSAADALASINTALEGVESDAFASELVAEDLRAAAHSLDAWVGRIDIEHVLDDVFRNFCLGK